MAAGTDRIKKYIGWGGDALAYVYQKVRGEQVGEPELEPPVGSKDKYGGPVISAPIIGGISTTTILLILAVWYFLKR